MDDQGQFRRLKPTSCSLRIVADSRAIQVLKAFMTIDTLVRAPENWPGWSAWHLRVVVSALSGECPTAGAVDHGGE